MELEVVEGNIAELEVDAIANAANNQLWMGAGVAGAIKGAGGAEIEREAVAKGPIELQIHVYGETFRNVGISEDWFALNAKVESADTFTSERPLTVKQPFDIWPVVGLHV